MLQENSEELQEATDAAQQAVDAVPLALDAAPASQVPPLRPHAVADACQAVLPQHLLALRESAVPSRERLLRQLQTYASKARSKLGENPGSIPPRSQDRASLLLRPFARRGEACATAAVRSGRWVSQCGAVRGP